MNAMVPLDKSGDNNQGTFAVVQLDKAEGNDKGTFLRKTDVCCTARISVLLINADKAANNVVTYVAKKMRWCMFCRDNLGGSTDHLAG